MSAVTPSRLAVGLRTEVSIAGFATQWSDGVRVSFGPGVTVCRIRYRMTT